MARAEAPPASGRHRFHIGAGCRHEQSVRLSGEQARQICRVLRLRSGDVIRVFDGSASEYQVTLETVSAEVVVGRITGEDCPKTEPPCRLWLALPLLKSDKLEWAIQKGVELGLSGILLTRTHRAIVQPGEERAAIRLERYRRIACEAAEQCGRLKIPPVEGPVSWMEAVERAPGFAFSLIAHTEATEPLRKAVSGCPDVSSALLFTGPEGGFAPDEIDAAIRSGLRPVTLGARTLRAETAALAGTAWLLAAMEDASATPGAGPTGCAARGASADTPAATRSGTPPEI